MSDTPAFEGWAILELMGHRKLAGYVGGAEIAGAGFLRIDIPSTPPITQFYAPQAVYGLTPVAEDVARRYAVGLAPTPVSRYELLPALADDRCICGHLADEHDKSNNNACSWGTCTCTTLERGLPRLPVDDEPEGVDEHEDPF